MTRPRFRSVSPAMVLLLMTAASGCERSEPPGPSTDRPASSGRGPQAGVPTLPQELKPSAPNKPAAPVVTAPVDPAANHSGPWFAVTGSTAGVYTEPSFESKKLGYVRSGGRVPVDAKTVSKANCTGGWYKIIGSGFICGNYGTTDLNHPEVKFAVSSPKLDEVLPYPYARNAKNGTPLYKSVPSREQMAQYEPYLESEKAAKAEKEKKKEEKAEPDIKTQASPAVAGGGQVLTAQLDSPLVDAGAPVDPAEAAEPDKPWWQRENVKERLHEVKLEHLEEDADDVLAKRMVTGFYVAVDRTFNWNGRTWYKTTKGMVTPSDRFWQTAGSKFKGIELGDTWQLPMGWAYGGNKSVSTYKLDADGKTLTPDKSIDRFSPIQLTSEEQEIRGKKYIKTKDGTWIRRSQVRVTEPGAPPADLASNERWIDVDLSSQTLVAYVGDKPVYATLISSGKESKVKDKDHRTPTGEWRVREKHITTTMDGDGTAAGDLPYSIEDVPYVMYFNRSYALHGAFWHSNFGVQMSHGCVNLAPLDAKHLFFFADPPLPKGWHGVWSNETKPGSRIVLHE